MKIIKTIIGLMMIIFSKQIIWDMVLCRGFIGVVLICNCISLGLYIIIVKVDK